MYKGLVRAEQTVIADTNIAFSTAINSNGNTTPNADNSVSINTTGYYNFFANIGITDAGATPIRVNLLANDEVIATSVIDTTVTTGITTLSILDTERVVVAPTNDKVRVSLQLPTTGTILPNSVFIIEKVR